MKNINTYISEKLQLRNVITYKYFPKSKDELYTLVRKLIDERGVNANLNDIDTSEITDMQDLFRNMTFIEHIDISAWDVSNVTNMDGLFANCRRLEIDISDWDVSKVECSSYMFYGCRKFNCDLGKWNTKSLHRAQFMFFCCAAFEGNGLENWDVSGVENMTSMFAYCDKFSANLSNWEIGSCTLFSDMFREDLKLKCNFEPWKNKMWDKAKIDDMFYGCSAKTKPSWYE